MVPFLAHNRQVTIAVIVGFLMLLLPLCAAFLVFPALTTAQGGETSLVANAGPDQTVPGPSPVAVQFDGSGSTGDIVSYQWYNQYGLLLAEEVTPVIEVNFGYEDPQPSTQRTFTLVVEDSQGNTAQDEVTITLGEEEETPPPDGGGGTDLTANAGPDQTVSGPSPIAVQLDGSGSTGDIVRYLWYNQWGELRAEGATPVIEVSFGKDNPQPGTQRTFILVVEDSQRNTAQDEVSITLGETGAADTEPPTVSWVKPVGNREYYPTANSTVELEVSATDNAGIRSVLFERWDAVNLQVIELSTDSSPPYQAKIEVNTLNIGWNQINAIVEDTAGNHAGEPIMIYRLNPAITLDPTEGSHSNVVTVQGSGWFPGDTVIISLGEAANEVTQATVDDEGNFTANFAVPANAVIGEQKVIATTANGFWGADAIFQVTEPEETPPPETEPTITLDPTEGPPGTEVTATGSGWPSGHDVIVQWDQTGSDLTVAAVDGSGGFTFSFTVPEDKAPRRQHNVLFFVVPPGTRSGGSFVPVPFTVTFPCPTPTVTFSPPSGKPGDTITMQGKGWIRGGMVDITAPGLEQFQVDSLLVPESGEWKRSVTVPGSPPGDYDLEFREDYDGCLLHVMERFTIVGQATPTPPVPKPVPTPTPPPDTEIPGGMWIDPYNNFVIKGNTLTFAAHAYDNQGGSGVDYVNFTVSYPGKNWFVACNETAPTKDDIYECEWDVSNVPDGLITVSFDVYDKGGNKRLAPHGLRKGEVQRAWLSSLSICGQGQYATQFNSSGSTFFSPALVPFSNAPVIRWDNNPSGFAPDAFYRIKDPQIAPLNPPFNSQEYGPLEFKIANWSSIERIDDPAACGPLPRRLIIFLQGIVTSLNGDQTEQGETIGMGAIPYSISKVFPATSTQPNASTRFLMYSYVGSRADNGLPEPYNCEHTVTNSILRDIQLLDRQIKNALKAQPAGAEVDIYLIGHSLGGAVALAYLDFLQQKLEVSLPPNAHLKTVITLDSPIGGFAPTPFSDKILRHLCPGLNEQTPSTSPSDLEEVYNSTSMTAPPEPGKTVPRGGRASLLVLHGETLPSPVPSNGDLTEAAQTALGTSFLSLGNINDFLWNQSACTAGVRPNFADTQFLDDGGDGKGLYGREFVDGFDTCPGLLTPEDRERTTQIVVNNHGVVLNNQEVQQGIQKFLTLLISEPVAGTPNPLDINRYQSLP